MEHDACDAGNEHSNATNDVDATKSSRSLDQIAFLDVCHSLLGHLAEWCKWLAEEQLAVPSWKRLDLDLEKLDASYSIKIFLYTHDTKMKRQFILT